MARRPSLSRLKRIRKVPTDGISAVAPGSILFNFVHTSCNSDVCFVGDSHTLICGAHLAYPSCDVDARPGRTSSDAMEIYEWWLSERHTVIVFEMATNDVGNPPLLGENLERLLAIAEDRQIVLVNTWRGDSPTTHVHVNAVMWEFAARNPEQTILVDWAAHVDDLGDKALGENTDYFHFSASAYLDRIALVTAAIEGARRRVAGVRG